MQPKLIKLLIVSRFSRPLIVVMFFVLVYSIMMSVLVPPEAMQMGPFWSYYMIGITAFFLALMTMMGGVAIMKSDLDYLFTLPLNRRELTVSLYITQFLATGISYLLIFGYVFAFLGGSVTTKLLIAGDMVLIGLLQTSISIIAFRLETKYKAILAAGISLYGVLPILGLNYSYTSVFTGNVLFGTIVIVILNVIFNYISLRELRTIELGFTKVTSMRSSAEYKSTERFAGLTQRAAIFRRYLTEFSLTGRFNMGGSVSVRVSRIRLRTLLIPMTAIAIIYAYLAILFNPSDGSPGVAPVLTMMYLGIFIPMFFPEVFSHERAWLAFSSMSAKNYWTYVVYAKMFQTLVMMIPFIAVNVYLFLSGVTATLNVIVFLTTVIPTSPAISLFFSGKFAPMQVIDMETLPSEFSLRQMATLLPVLLFSVTAIISIISIWIALICGAFFIVFAILVMSSGKRWNRLVFRLTERGFV